MNQPSLLPYELSPSIGQDCLCLRVQRASRAIGRRYDEAFRPLGLNNWQFSLLMVLNRAEPPSVNGLAEALAMDRTTTTKNLKPLERRGLVEIRRDADDARVKRVVLTDGGRALLVEAVQRWQVVNDATKASFSEADLAALRSSLETIAAG